MAQRPLVGHGFLIIEASTSHSVGLLWTSDQPDITQHSLEISMPPSRYEPIIPASEQPQTNAFDYAVIGTGHFVLMQFHRLQQRRKVTNVPSLAEICGHKDELPLQSHWMDDRRTTLGRMTCSQGISQSYQQKQYHVILYSSNYSYY